MHWPAWCAREEAGVRAGDRRDCGEEARVTVAEVFVPVPFVALMRRYCIDYTNSHDFSVCDEVMEPGYLLHIGGHRLGPRDESYKPATARQLSQFPGLGLVVQQIVTSGDRLALRFAEHGASLRHGRYVAAWQGIGLYQWNGRRLTESWVEQDYWSRRRQLVTGEPNPVPRPAHDPWVTPAVPADPQCEQAVQRWLESWTGVPDDRVRADDSSVAGWEEPVVDGELHVDDLFSAGSSVAFHVTRSGRYRGGLPGLDAHIGRPVSSYCAGIATVAGGEVTDVAVVTDRLGLSKRLARPTGR